MTATQQVEAARLCEMTQYGLQCVSRAADPTNGIAVSDEYRAYAIVRTAARQANLFLDSCSKMTLDEFLEECADHKLWFTTKWVLRSLREIKGEKHEEAD